MSDGTSEIVFKAVPVPGPITAALQACDNPGAAPGWLPWRQHERQPRIVMALLGPEPSEDDPIIGWMETVDLAGEVVLSHNAALRRMQAMPLQGEL